MKLLPDNSNLKEVLEDSRLYTLAQGGSPADLTGADLTGADLSEAYLPRADMRRACLTGANLSGADLRDANLHGACLRGADLIDANLRGADLIDANLRGANLYGANLRWANLRWADLRWADLRRAKLNWQSHALIGEVLRQEAGENIARRQIAGLVANSTDLCWSDFLKLRLKERRWALTALAKYIQPDDNHPAVLDKYRKET